MSDAPTPPEYEAPSAKRLIVSTVVAIIVAAAVLMAFVLPAEYGLDPTGIGRLTGIDALGQPPTRTIEISNVIGGNESLRELEIPDFGEPVPLPNPEVYQHEERAAQTQEFSVTIPPEQETEIKTVLGEGKMITFSWRTDEGMIYSDFHGHDPALGDDFWVRYREHQEGNGDDGSLVAPFAGEHGWYWLNFNEFPVTVTLTVTGYFDDMIDYGIF
jgi:hypothetical protein